MVLRSYSPFPRGIRLGVSTIQGYSKPNDQKNMLDKRLRQWYLDIKKLEEGDEKNTLLEDILAEMEVDVRVRVACQ